MALATGAYLIADGRQRLSGFALAVVGSQRAKRAVMLPAWLILVGVFFLDSQSPFSAASRTSERSMRRIAVMPINGRPVAGTAICASRCLLVRNLLWLAPWAALSAIPSVLRGFCLPRLGGR